LAWKSLIMDLQSNVLTSLPQFYYQEAIIGHRGPHMATVN